MNRTSSKILVVAASVALATTFAGCGSSDSGKTPTLTSAQFKSQADKLCVDANKETDSYGANITESSSDADVAAAIKQTVDRDKKLVSDIEKLKAPADVKSDVKSMLDDVRSGLDQMGKIGSVADLKTFDPTTGVFKDANDKATALGLPDCAK
jgi:hypothetical protein